MTYSINAYKNITDNRDETETGVWEIGVEHDNCSDN